MKNISKYISHMARCIEVVGYKQRNLKRINIDSLKTNIINKKNDQSVK
jgi:hypothetical protein|tara:strand:- start:56 stop:199 length:144 start_codon:yes stop_codon:yes gene_type:complete